MTHLIGPDFVGLQADDPDAARAFHRDKLGLSMIDGPPDAVVFAAKPIPFAGRKPLVDLDVAARHLGWGVAIWFARDDADALPERLNAEGVGVLSPPKPGPFGSHFGFRDPFGYAITVHTA